MRSAIKTLVACMHVCITEVVLGGGAKLQSVTSYLLYFVLHVRGHKQMQLGSSS